MAHLCLAEQSHSILIAFLVCPEAAAELPRALARPA